MTVDDDLDLVRVKPNNQVPIANFWAAMEPYFRPITEDDRKYLMEKVYIFIMDYFFLYVYEHFTETNFLYMYL